MMAPVTSSAINKSKTVAPKAIARRRPAAPPAPKPRPLPEESTLVEQDTSPSQTSTQPHSEPPGPTSRHEPPTHHSLSQNVAAPAFQPTPPPTQPSPSRAEPTPPPTRQDATGHVVPRPTHLEPAPFPSAATPDGPSAGADVNPETSSLSPAPRIQSPAPLAGSKRKRTTTSIPNTVEHPIVCAPSPQAGPPPHDGTVQEPDNHVQTGPDHAQGTTELQPATSAAPVAQMISPERSRRSARSSRAAAKSPPAPKVSRAKRQKNAPAANIQPSTTEASVDSSVTIAINQDLDQNIATSSAGTGANKTKKPRAKRQPKSAARVVENGNEEADGTPGAEQATEEQEPSAPKQSKPRQPRQPREPRKKKDPREATANDENIEDPELHEIDPNAVTMSDLTRDRKLGKQSERESKMANIDWKDVARKRLEAAEAIREGTAPGTDGSRKASTAEIGEDGEDGTPRPRPNASGPRLRVDADGNLTVEEDSLRIDRQAQAEANAANLVVTEEDDLTKRVNQMSWVSDRRKDPTERLPFFKMKSDPWSEEETDRFYEALKMFGTDFFIISKMFPPKTRRQIKLKFIREERLDADRVNRALSGESTVPMSLNHFAEATGQDIEKFKDPRELEEELRQEGEEQREEIAKKKKEIEEAKQQRDVQMAAREKEQAERAQIRKNKAMQRRGKRGVPQGTGTF